MPDPFFTLLELAAISLLSGLIFWVAFYYLRDGSSDVKGLAAVPHNLLIILAWVTGSVLFASLTGLVIYGGSTIFASYPIVVIIVIFTISLFYFFVGHHKRKRRRH
jgi:hypothetical protein